MKIFIAGIASAGILLAVLVGCGSVGSFGRADNSLQEVADPAETGQVTDGMWLVGKDIPAGTYRSQGAADSSIPNCYWQRAKDASGALESIIANGNTVGPVVITISAGEYLTVNGCKPFVLT